MSRRGKCNTEDPIVSAELFENGLQKFCVVHWPCKIADVAVDVENSTSVCITRAFLLLTLSQMPEGLHLCLSFIEHLHHSFCTMRSENKASEITPHLLC